MQPVHPVCIASGGISHETSTFAPITDDVSATSRMASASRQGHRERFRAPTTAPAASSRAEQHGLQLSRPLTFAYPGGLIRRTDYYAA